MADGKPMSGDTRRSAARGPCGGAGRSSGRSMDTRRGVTTLMKIYFFFRDRETLINEPVVRITDEAGCNFQIDVGI
ncbi:hypothetical protein A8E36_38720 [Burkholderia cenocepacia]|nr:hypothetical protein A8E36_38720 [Burkholderia cenocepacia]ONT08602.1 hypothetical protein A8E37_03025 [Burkholderia cenocepacia]ONT35498.1 hypothetical protein A8E41_18865 [Burkholderia cenocepacia]ONT76293.1 hypothetical protein A8E46_05350 [Burkholderia cenocepacia]ONT99851.1 hypothetical protein A8E45_05525 [Burkholderia cenocepacia]